MKRFFLASALILTAALAAAAQTPATSRDDHPKLPPGEGRDVMIHVCSACHEPDNVADQQLTEGDWKRLVDEMAAMGADATDAQLDQIVHYLATSFPPSK
jgi:competence protein ComEA